MTPTLRLEADGLEPLVFDEYDGWIVRAMDQGAPIVREDAYDNPGSDGSTDFTRLHGARNITVQIDVFPDLDEQDLWERRNRLKAFTLPRRRPRLVFVWPDRPAQQATVRYGDLSDPIDQLTHAAITTQWVVPSGILESVDELTDSVLAAGPSTQTGLAFPIEFPIAWEPAAVSGAGGVVNDGTADVWPLLRLYGPCDGPSISNVTTGQEMTFANTLTIAAGDFLELDSAAKTVRYNGNANDSRYGDVDFATSEWWPLQPGVNEIRYAPDSFSGPAQAQVVWRHGWL